LRAELGLEELFGVVSSARCVISVDSAVLHLATHLRFPVVAIFGGIDPSFRLSEEYRAVALVANLACGPCNKQETCDSHFDRMLRIKPRHVIEAISEVRRGSGRMIRSV
jgi:ADP-heptose:LPS heptosyltransferase